MMAQEAAERFDMMGASVAAYEQRRSVAVGFRGSVVRSAPHAGQAPAPRVRHVSLRGGFHRGEGRRLVMAGRIMWE